MNLLFVQGGGILTALSLLSLSSLYCYLSFALFNNIRFRDVLKKDQYKNISVARIIGTILTGFILSIAVIGILFKIQSWNGAHLYLVIGIGGLVVIIIIGLVRYIKTKSSFYVNLIKRVIVIGIFATIFQLLPQETLINIKFRNHPEYISALKNVMSDPDNQEFQKKFQEERKKLYEEKQ